MLTHPILPCWHQGKRFLQVIYSSLKARSMAQMPIAMEYLKQILQLQKDGVPICEMTSRTGISRNSVRKYISLIVTAEGQPEVTDHKTLAEKACGSDTVVHDANRFQVYSIPITKNPATAGSEQHRLHRWRYEPEAAELLVEVLILIPSIVCCYCVCQQATCCT
jgi:hypothetical protein